MIKLNLPVPARCTMALHAMVPPLPPPLLLPPPPQSLVSEEDYAHSTDADSSPAALAHSICRALKAHVLVDQSLPSGCVGIKDGKDDDRDDNSDASDGGRDSDLAPDRDGPPPR